MNSDNEPSRLSRWSITRKKHHFFLGIFTIIAIAVFCVFVLAGHVFFNYVASAPKINNNAMTTDNSTKIYDANGHLISKLGALNRDWVPYNQIPANVQNGLTSIEDRHFWTSKGIDPGRILEAAINDAKGSGGIQGGSTLTQQLVKLSVFSTQASNRTLKRKAQEAWLAMKVDRIIPKKDILTFYINKVYMGHNCYGMKTASDYYFNKPLNKLDLAQSALLAGMPQSPVQYDPYRFPKVATKRRNEVLNAMIANHKATAKQVHQAEKESVKTGLATSHQTANQNMAKEHIVDSYLKATLQELQARGYKLHAGLKVYTNLDMNNQQKMYNLANNDSSVGFPNKEFQVGSALVDAKTGKVNSMIGGRKLDNQAPFGLNRAMQTTRSTGSICKPYEDVAPLLAEDPEMGTQRTWDDEPIHYPGGPEVKDYDLKYDGPMSMQSALVQSRNTVAVKESEDVGIQKSKQNLQNLGVDPGKNYSLQNAIGVYSSPLQQANIAATISNGGIYHQPQFINKIQESNGDTHYINPGQGKRVMPQGVAFMLIHMLKNEFYDPQAFSQDARISGVHEWGKSGTTELTDAYRGAKPSGYSAMDSWYLCGTPQYGMAVWNGFDDPDKPGNYITANQLKVTQKFYKYMMSYAMHQKGMDNTNWKQPNDVAYDDNIGYHLKHANQ